MKKNLLLVLLAASVFTVAKAEEQTVECGKTVQITAEAKSGYRFIKWSDDTPDNPQREATRVVTNVTTDFDLQAIFAKVYALNISATTGGSVVVMDGEEEKPLPDNLELLEGESITIKAKLADDCQEFKGWSDGETELTRTITANSLLTTLDIQAQFQVRTFKFKVAAEDDNMGSVSFSVVTE